jgi:uncharacterized protein YgiM (DUF1202 family)
MKRSLILFMMLMLGLGFAWLQPQQVTQAQGQFSWQGEYFNNSFLFAPSAFTRTDNTIAFNWAGGSPASGINADGFSVRWGADAFFPAGTYRFWVLADDEIRLNVGYAFRAQLDTFGQNLAGQLRFVDITLPEGVHHMQVDYSEGSGNAFAYVTITAPNVSSPNFPALSAPPPVNVGSGPWTAQYYPNAGLSGTPSLIQSEASVSRNWGPNAPYSGFPADNFSVRWTSVQTLNAGAYTLTVRADDGVRVYVDGVLTINEWHLAANTTYTFNLNLTAGPHTFVVEFYEASGDAFIEYTLSQGSAPPVVVPPPGQGGGVVTGTSATVTAFRLNVRANPSASAAILTKINRNEVYAVLGRNNDSSWYQINVNGVVGWVSSRFITVQGAQVNVVSNAPTLQQPVDTGYNVTALTRLNVRNAPSRSGQIQTRMNINDIARVIGRTADNSWWNVNYNGTVGWVSSTFGQIQPGVDLNRIPVTG